MFGRFSLKATHLKCFGEEAQGFEELKLINLIIGRNNSGKSTLVDLLHQATLKEVAFTDMHRRKGAPPPSILTTTLVGEPSISRAFPFSTSGGPIEGNHYEFGKRFIKGELTVRLGINDAHEFVGYRPAPDGAASQASLADYPEQNRLITQRPERNPLKGKIFWRLAAERDIVEEPDAQNGALDVFSNGRGITNMLQAYLNKSYLPSELVQDTLLSALNEVFGPDASFINLTTQMHRSNLWELYLFEKGKGRIALSQSGSGLKTIIHALCYIHLLPHQSGRPLSEYIFAFEELENNLHPAMQRRLLNYIAKKAREHQFIAVFTTHSSVAIDLFNTETDAQIVHVTHDGAQAKCQSVKAYIEQSGVLDDLDVRASDLLQSNGVIWVEGPSDRIYINRWIDLWSGGQFREGSHYQCVFYGGRLLAHLAAGTDGDPEAEGVSILRVNRNAAVLIDSDKRTEDSEINATKKRVCQEIENVGGYAWVTDGREIENYLPMGLIGRWLAKDLGSISTEPFDSFFELLNSIVPLLGDKEAQRKPMLAEQLSRITTREDLESAPNLSARLDAMCRSLRSWNQVTS
jgi:putative ATP-dependent endonuclease of OLD family